MQTLKGFSICSGIGGLDIAFQSEYIGVQTIGYCEIEPYAQAILLSRMREGWLDSAPIWPDIKTLEESTIGNVDIIYGGIPCQPHSIAGKRKREEDARDLWPDTYRILRDVRPRFFFLENVSGFSTRSGESPAFAWRILDDLTRIGYEFRWTHIAAQEVGAPHRRKRFFLLAYTRCEHEHLFEWFHGKEPETSSSGVAYTNTGLRESKKEQILPRRNISGNIGSGFPPDSEDSQQWQFILKRYPQLAPAIESNLRGRVDGLAVGVDKYRRKRLEGLGNGVVPQQAIQAWLTLTNDYSLT